MGWTQTVFGAVLVAVLLTVSLFYAWRQGRALRDLDRDPDLPPVERRRLRRQAWRRLVNSGLMLLLAGLLAGALIYLEAEAQRLNDVADLRKANPEAVPPHTPAEREFVNLYSLYWIALLLVLLAIVALAGLDLWSTRRYGLEQYRRLQAERRAMIESQVERLRRERGRQE